MSDFYRRFRLAWLALANGNRGVSNYGIEEIASAPLTVRLEIRYDIVARPKRSNAARSVLDPGAPSGRAQRSPMAWKARRWEAGEETLERHARPRVYRRHLAGPRRNGVVQEPDAARRPTTGARCSMAHAALMCTATTAWPRATSTTTASMIFMSASRRDCPIGFTAIAATELLKT